MASTASGWQYAVPNDTLVAWPAVSQAVADKLETHLPKPAGSVVVANATFSGATTYSANNVFSAAFDNYLVVLSGFSVASLGNIEMRMRVGGVDTSSSDYRYGRMYVGALGLQAFGSTNAAVSTTWPVGQAASGLNNNCATFEIKAPFLSTNTSYTSLSAGNLLDINGGVMTLSTSYTGFTLLNSSGGNISGTIRIYGLRNTA